MEHLESTNPRLVWSVDELLELLKKEGRPVYRQDCDPGDEDDREDTQ